jgi:hypothetical protein
VRLSRRTSFMLALSLGCAFVLLASQPAAAKNGPVITRFTDSGRFVDTDLCGYPIRVAWHERGRVYEWYDSDGNVTRLVVHDTFYETARANGKVAIGIDREKLTDTQQGDYVFTGSWIYFLPDGSHIQNAGRLEVPYDFSTIVSEHGPHPIAEGRLAELFCPAMS